MFQAINPATSEIIRSIPFDDGETIRIKLELSRKAASISKQIPLVRRIESVLRLGELLLSKKEELATLMTEEMGKPISQSYPEIEKCAWLCEYFAGAAPSILKPKYIETAASKSYISYQPLGSILAVMPWNFPFWQVIRFAVPNLLAGNVILLKHSPNTPGCCVALDDLFIEAGFHEDAVTPLYIPVEKMEEVIASNIVKGVTLTGSTRAGRSVAQLAGKYIKKSVLELGGNDAFIILDDADIDHAVHTCVTSRSRNAGQSCIGAKRIIVVENVYDTFLEKFKTEFSKHVLGDPTSKDTKMGPMAREDLRDKTHQQVGDSIRAGAKLILGGEIPNQKGAWYPATILTDIPKDCPASQEELFGPVACIFKVKDEKEAIELANDSAYGLGAAIFTEDIEKGERIAREELNAGSCFVNEMVKSDPRVPFGGIGISGYGREMGKEGMLEFMNMKTVFLK